MTSPLQTNDDRNRNRRRPVMTPATRWLLRLDSVVVTTEIVLMRIDGVFEVRDPTVGESAWWLHSLAPIGVGWLFFLHRPAGARIRWMIGAGWLSVSAIAAARSGCE